MNLPGYVEILLPADVCPDPLPPGFLTAFSRIHHSLGNFQLQDNLRFHASDYLPLSQSLGLFRWAFFLRWILEEKQCL